MLAVPSKDVAPTAAETVKVLTQRGEHLFDIKWDGVRCMAFVDCGTVKLINRRGNDITFQYPDVVEPLAALYPHESRVFDGEMIVFDPQTGRPSFNLLQRRNAQHSTEQAQVLINHGITATFMAFDILWSGAQDLRRQTNEQRYQALRDDAPRFKTISPRMMLSVISTNGEQMWKVILEQDMEGLIAKAKTSRYSGRRDPNWVKIKKSAHVTAMVTGIKEGNGKRKDSLGALHLGLWRDDTYTEIVDIGKVGTGWTDAQVADLRRLIDQGQPVIVEVEYNEISKEGKLRHPSWRGVRTDVDTTSCTYDQLTTGR